MPVKDKNYPIKSLEEEQKEKIKSAIEYYELRSNGYNSWACPPEITLRNIRWRKEKVIADVVVRFLEEGTTERYNDIEYDIDMIERIGGFE